MAALLASNQLG